MKPAEIYILNHPEFYRYLLINLQLIIHNTAP